MKSLRILVFTVCFFSCKSPVPNDVLPPKKMQAVLWDVMQADEMAEYYSSKDSTYHSLSKHADYYQKVFSIHKISKKDFTRSLDYYENHPASLKTILDSLQKFGERLQKRDTLNKNQYGQKSRDSSKKKLTDTLHPQ
jgi:hypothetical protein